MAKTESAETIRRRLFILTTLSRAKVTAKIIHNRVATEGINVDRRSIQRDLKYLVDHFPNQIEVDDRDPTYGYGYRQPSHARKYSAMSPIEAICFELVKKFIKPLKESIEFKFLLSSKIFFKFFLGLFINSNLHSLDKVSAFLSDIFLGIPA